MCLDTVDQKIRKEICTGVGWKTFIKKDGKLFGECENCIKERPEHKWLDEEKFRRYKSCDKIPVSCVVELASYLERKGRNENEYYHTGWHIFPTSKEAYAYAYTATVVQVEYKHVFSTGEQNGRDVIVARWIRIGGMK